jgi:hypothetical protein
LRPVGSISPLIPLLCLLLFLLIFATAAIILPPAIVSLENQQGKSILSNWKMWVKLFILDNYCYPGCWNGGSCSAQNVCTCVTGFNGDRCQTRKIISDSFWLE